MTEHEPAPPRVEDGVEAGAVAPARGLGAVAAPIRRVGHWSDRVASDPRHSTRTAAILGASLGVCFTLCFLTGVYSHLAQHPADWFSLPAEPSWLFRFTQGLHVATGIAAVPLLLAKLWTVYPKLLRLPPIHGVAHLIERISLVPLVAGSLFMLFSGVANIDLWYPLPLFFPTGHYWVAWLTMGALVAHIGAKWTLSVDALGRGGGRAVDVPVEVDVATRRRFLAGVGGASALLTALTVGQTIESLRRLALLAPRDPGVGVQGFPVNGAADEAHVTVAALDPNWRLRVTGAVAETLELSLADLRGFALAEAVLPIACVEGWSATRRWRGVRLVDLLDRAGAPAGASVTVASLETGLYARSEVNPAQAHHPDTLLALDVEGEPLALDHGYPVRLIGPNRPGVMQTKWLSVIEVHA